ncbi:hypothetical protein Leryth_003934 [Lithospermum erythrorhizon]|nr:hypothetical protein Leryth_003934 [Lithospermum erythrorhizon]
MSLLIFPIWSGEDLHKSTIWKIEGLARSIDACVGDYFSDDDPNKPEDTSLDDLIYKGYKAVVDSKSIDDTLALYSSWEPRHSRKCHKFPGQQYVKLGAVLRHFGYIVIALHGCLQTEIQTPLSVRLLFKDPCIRLAGEVSRALRELADCIRHRQICSTEILSDNLQQALHDLNAAFKSQPKLFLGQNNRNNNSANDPSTPTMVKSEPKKGNSNRTNNDVVTPKQAERKVLRHTISKIVITRLEFSETLPFSAFASMLVEAVARLDLVIEQVEELGNVANFKECTRPPGDQLINVKACEITYSPDNFPSHGID